jgi:hypothetical protein
MLIAPRTMIVRETEELSYKFIKSSLKNKHAYACKQGYFQELSNADNTEGNKHEESPDTDLGDDEPDDEPEAESGESKGGNN